MLQQVTAAASTATGASLAIAAVLLAWAALGLVLWRDRRPQPAPAASAPAPPPAPPAAPPAAAVAPTPTAPVTPAHRSARPSAPAARLAALAGAVLVPVAGLAVINSTSGFVWDDIKNLRQAQVQRLSLSYLVAPTSGHFAPGHRLGDWIAERAFGFHFAPAQALLLIGFALSLLLFHRILTELFRPGAGPILLTLAYGVSMVHVGVTQWWSSGLDRVPATVLSFVAILAYLRWYRTRAWPYLAVSVVAVPLGLLFYIKPAFVPVYLVLIRLLLLERDRRLRDTLVDTAREWKVWLLYAVTTGAMAVFYVSRYPTQLNQKVGSEEILRYLSILWERVFVPNLFGIYVPQLQVPPSTWAAAVAGHVLLVALVVWSIARNRAAWRAWAFFAATFLVNALVVGATRVGYFPAKIIAYTTYFNLECVFLFFLALAAALLPGRTSVAARARPVGRRPDVGRFAVGVGLAAYVGLSFWGGYRISEPENWIGARSRVTLDRTAADLAHLRDAGTPVALVDGVFPDDVMPYLLVPYNNTSEVVPLIDPAATFDPSAGDLYQVARNGRLDAVAFAPDSGGAANQLVQTADFGIVGAPAEYLFGDRVCVRAGAVTVTIGFQPPKPLVGDGLAVSMEFESRAPSVMSLVADPIPVITEGPAQARQKFRVVNIAGRARQRRIYALDASRANRVLVVLAPHTDLCLFRLEVGRLVPR